MSDDIAYSQDPQFDAYVKELVAETVERWQIIEDIAGSDPWVTAPGGTVCRHCSGTSDGRGDAHRVTCTWLRSDKLVARRAATRQEQT